MFLQVSKDASAIAASEPDVTAGKLEESLVAIGVTATPATGTKKTSRKAAWAQEDGQQDGGARSTEKGDKVGVMYVLL